MICSTRKNVNVRNIMAARLDSFWAELRAEAWWKTSFLAVVVVISDTSSSDSDLSCV